MVGRLTLYDEGPSSRSDAFQTQNILAKSALVDFDCELPHAWQRIGDYLLRPVTWILPRVASAPPLAFGRNANHVLGKNGLTKGGTNLKWFAWLEEVCLVLGLDVETRRSRRGPVSKHVTKALRCPELWLDEQWPPNKVTPRSKKSVPVWTYSTIAPERGIIVIQTSMLKEFPAKEAKALIGFEVGRMVLQRLPTVIPGGFVNSLANVYLATSAYIALQKATRPKPGLAGAPQWIRDILADHSRFSLKRPYSYTGTTAELAAFGTILRRLVPGLLQLPLFAGLQENHQTFEKALEHQAPLKLRWREEKERPMHDMADSFLLVNAMRILSGSRGRSFVLTLDRAAALAAGDAKAAASALLRARRLIPARLAKADLDETLASFVESAHDNAWNFRQEALLHNPRDPPPAVRVAELLHWAKTDSGKRLLALAEVRRHGVSGVQWPGNEELWRPSAGYTAIGGLLLLPLLTPIDAVRWASWCTMSLTVFGLMLPMLHLLGAPSLPAPALLSLGSLLLYCLIAGSIWWNHLLGGARRWAILSGQLASQLVDQADAAAGIAFLTRDWAEMARRSLVALDQELCGSWRTSLHELASKLADLRQELEESHPPPSNGIQKSIRDGYSSVPAEEDGMPQRLAAWAGRMEAAVERPTAKQPLWLKVDRAVQRAARVESARMRCALECSDPDQMQAMMTWWMARDQSAASSGGTATARLLQEDSCSAEEAGEGETLGTLLFSERLHRRFPYVSFYGPNDYAVGGSVSEADGSLEFERLQQALQQNLQALQDLRSRLAPYQESSRSSLFWKWSDVVAVATRFREALGFPAKAAKAAASGTFGLGRGIEEVDLSDSLAEFTTIFGLFLAALVGMIGSGGAVLGHQWGWAAGLLAFGCANSVLLQNYSRLHLPHVRRRLEQRLKELSQQKDALLKDVQQVQRASRKTGIVQLRAHIFLQSVNVIRNMDYLTRCIKTEVQRMSSEKARKTQLQKRLVASGLQLLLALLPHSSPEWQEEALGGEQCVELASVIFSRRAVQSNQASQLISSSYADSRKRLWLLFRMVHLSSAIPTEVQGKLSALMDSYLRPVLVERRLPTGYCQAVGRGLQPQAMLEDGLQQGTRSARRDEERPKSPTARGRSASGSAASVDEEAESEDHFSFAASTASKVSNSSASKVTSDTSKAVRRLFATRGDLLQVLKRLPQQALQSQGGCSTQAESLLRGICTSVVVGVPQELVPNSQAASNAPALVGLGIGYRYGRNYSLSFAQITLELTVVVPTSAGPKELSVQFSQLSDCEPSSADASNAWSDLTAALPLRFNDAALRVRRRNLKKAKETLRSLR